MQQYACGFSEHPQVQEAVGDVVSQVQQALGGRAPGIVLMFTSGQYLKEFGQISRSIRTLLSPKEFVGVAAGSVMGGHRHTDIGPGLSVWAASGEDACFSVMHFKNEDCLPQTGELILLADPFSFMAPELQQGSRSNLKVVGGYLLSGKKPGDNCMILGDTVYRDGAVGIQLPHSPGASKFVISQGCKPVGRPYTVTNASSNRLKLMGGQPPLKRLSQIFKEMELEDREKLKRGLRLGIAVREDKLDLKQGDFLVRVVLQMDRNGELEINGQLQVGDLVQFQMLDPQSASTDLSQVLSSETAKSALLFTCNGRAASLFKNKNHDPDVVSTALSDIPLAGISCAGEFGPIGGKNFLHEFTASMALFN